MTTDEAGRESERADAALRAVVDAAERDARAALADARKVRAGLKDGSAEASREARARVRARLTPVRVRQLRVLATPDRADTDARSARSG